MHPRPQLTRPQWTDLRGEWDFAFDDDDTGLDEAWWRDFPVAGKRGMSGASGPGKIIVPFPPESPLSGVGDTRPHRVIWYRKRLSAPEGGGRLMLRIGACDYGADVWCNGLFVGSHVGGHTPFSCDLTRAVADGEIEIVIRAHDDPLDVTQPRGKQDWSAEPHGVWYPRTTGIWQPVWLERVPARHVAGLAWRVDLARGVVRCEAALVGKPSAGERLAVRLSAGGDLLAEQEAVTGGDTCRLEISIAALGNGVDRGRLLWSPESPVLVDADVRLLDAGRGVVDAVGSYLGLREVGTSGPHFLLNGRPYFLRLVLEQGLWPESHLAAPHDEAIRREVEHAKRMGFNGVRLHQKIEDPRFLACCDQLGLVVWEEMPSCYEFSPAAVTRLAREWSEAVLRDRSHPCIVCWVPLNESWGVPDLPARRDHRSLAQALVHLTRALDDTRPVVSNDGWEHLDSDVLTIHDYAPTGQELRDRYGTGDALGRTIHGRWPGPRRVLLDERDRLARPVMVTEFGGVSIVPPPDGHSSGYASVSSAQALADRFADLTAALLSSDVLAGFCYTQLTDTFQERNGLLRADRTAKVPVELIRAAVSQVAASTPRESVDRARQLARDAVPGDDSPDGWGESRQPAKGTAS